MNSALIGKRIRTIREEKGWKQEVFAEKVGLSPTYIGMIERGEKIPKLETFVRIQPICCLRMSCKRSCSQTPPRELPQSTRSTPQVGNAFMM